MKKVRYFFSSFLLLVLCLDIIRLPITIFSETVSATTPLTIRTKYIEHLKEDGQKLAIKLDTSQKQLDRLDVIVQIEEGVDISKGLSLVVQNELELESQLDEQGVPKEKLPPGFVKDEDYREEDVPKEFPEQEVAPTVATQDSLEASLPVYGLGYYSIKIKPEPERHIEWKVDEEKPERRYEEILLRLKIKKPLQTGQFMAVLSSDYKTILTEDWKTFEELVKRNSIEMVTDSVASDTEQPIPETSESTSDNTQPNPVPEGEEVIQEEQALAIQTANLRLVLREHEEGVLQPSKPIAGAEFIITSVENPEISYNGRTDEQGILDWKDLPLGEYQISQLSTAQGYEVEKQLTVIQLQESGAEKIIHVTNAKKNGLEGRIGSMLRSARTRRAITETNTDRTTTIINNPNGTTTTVTKEEEITKDIFDPIRLVIPGTSTNFSQNGQLRKKEIKTDNSGQATSIVWEYTTTVAGADSSFVKKLTNHFSTTPDSGLGEPVIVDVKKNGQTIQGRHMQIADDALKSTYSELPIENGRYTYTIETPITAPRDYYTLLYHSEAKVQPNRTSQFTQGGVTTTIQANEEKRIPTSGFLSLPSQDWGGSMSKLQADTVYLSNGANVAGDYTAEDKIKWVQSNINNSKERSHFDFSVAVDNSQRIDRVTVKIYEPTDTGYREVREEVVTVQGGRVTARDVPPGGIAVVETETTVTNQKVNHTFVGAELAALKKDLTIKKVWLDNAPAVDVNFTVNGGRFNNRTFTLSRGQSQIVEQNVLTFSTSSNPFKTGKKIFYDVNEVEPSGYSLVAAEQDTEELIYTYKNKKNTSRPVPTNPGTCSHYGITSVQNTDIKYFRLSDGWQGFGSPLTMQFRIPAYAEEGDYFEIKIPRELVLKHVANPNKVWKEIQANGRHVANVYHVEQDKIRFILTADAYSVADYTGSFFIGDEIRGATHINGRPVSGSEKYYDGVNPRIEYFFDPTNPLGTKEVRKTLQFETKYHGGGMECSKTVTNQTTANYSDREIMKLSGAVNKWMSYTDADEMVWDVVYNAAGGDIWGNSGLYGNARKFFEHLTETNQLYNGNNPSSFIKDIEVYLVDGTAAGGYRYDTMQKLTPTAQLLGRGTQEYLLPGTNVKIHLTGSTQNWAPSNFIGANNRQFKSNYKIEFYYEGSNIGRKAILAKIRTRKMIAPTENYFFNAVTANRYPWLNGGSTLEYYRREADTLAWGGAYPVDWYSLRLRKVGNENGQKRPLQGAVFTLSRDGKVVRRVTSDSDGILNIRDVYGGTYKLREVSAPEGYALDPTEKEIVIRNADNITIDGRPYNANTPPEIVNTKYISLQIDKYTQGETRRLKGAVFRLRSKENNRYSVTLGENTSSATFLFTNLAKGTYVLEELTAPAGYKKITPIEIEVYEDAGVLKVRKLTDTNHIQSGHVFESNGTFRLNVVNEDINQEFTKVNTERQPLADAIFELRKMKQDGYDVIRRGIATNAAGKFRLNNLQPNSQYEVWETVAPEGYEKPTSAVAKFRVTAAGQIEFTENSSTLINRRPDNKKFQFRVVKVDAVTNQPITSQSRIGITDADGSVIGGQVANFTSGGTYTFHNQNQNFVAGTYYIKEFTAPAGYNILPEPIPFTVNNDGTFHTTNPNLIISNQGGNQPITLEIRVKNYKKATLRFTKRIKGIENVQGAISGDVTFRLTKDNDSSFTAVEKTQSGNSDFVIENLAPGTYTLEEVTPPQGYVKEKATYKVEVSNDGSIKYYKNISQVSVIKSEHFNRYINNTTDANMIDGSDASEVIFDTNVNGQSNIVADSYLGIDLGSTQRVTHIRILQGRAGNHSDRMAKAILEYSEDGVSYTVIQNGTSNHFTDRLIDLDVAVNARYVRIRNAEPVVNKWMAIQEFQVQADAQTILYNQAGSNEKILVGNIQNPSIAIVKVNPQDEVMTGANLTARFKLYKVANDTTNQNVSERIQDSGLVQEFTWQSGSTTASLLSAKELGRYALVETQAPTGYRRLNNPILLDLFETGQSHDGTRNKAVTRFRKVYDTESDLVIDTTNTVNDNTIKLKVKNYPDRYQLKLLKRALNGTTGLVARFELYDSQDRKVAEGRTDREGNSYLFRDLAPGTYRLRETESPRGYYLHNDIRVTIGERGEASIDSGSTELVSIAPANSQNTIELTVKNKPYTAFSIEKVSKLAPTTTLMNVKLEIKAKDGVLSPIFSDEAWHREHYRAEIDTANRALRWWTSAKGNAVFSLPAGTYTVTELEAPAGYERMAPFDIIMTEDGQVVVPTNNAQVEVGEKDNRVHIKLTNVFKPKIKITKVDSREVNRKLAGARFKLFGPDENTQIGQEVTTGTNGEITLPGLEPGTYYLQESQPPTDYQANSLKYQIIIDANGSAQITNADGKIEVGASQNQGADKIIPITVKNERETYDLKILKRDAQNAQQGLIATFGLYNADGISKITEGQTNESDHSHTFSQLLPGTYVLKEETPPSGYIQVDPVRLEITQAGQLRILSGDTELLQVGASSGNTLQLTVKNDSKKTLRISKRIKGLEDLPSLITGEMTFTLTKDNDATAVSAVQTHAATEDFVFTNLTYGSYTLVETTPPAGYMVEPIVYKVAVSRAGVSLYKVANAAPIERVTGATLIKSPDLSNIQSGQDGNAIDGSDTTSVTYENFNGQGNNIPAGAYLGVDLQGVKRVRHIHYLQGTQRNAHDRFNRFTLEYSIDGRTYFPLSTYTEHGLVNLNTDIVARYIRVRNEDRVEQKWYGVRELTVSAQATETVNALSAGQYPIGNIQHPQIQVEKRDMSNARINQSVTFKLYKVDDATTTANAAAAIQESNLVQTFTLTNGQVSQALQAKVQGRYALVEVAPPTGYRALAGPVLLDLTTAQETHSGSQMKTVSRFTLVDSTDKVTIDTATANVLKIFVKNELLTYNLLIKKRDLANPNTGLDARFELYNENESTKLEQGNTTQTGNSLTFRNLRPGTYVLKEVTAPTGYNPIQKIKLTISLDGQITIVEGPQDLLEGQAVNANNEIELVVKNRPFTDFSIEKVSNLTPTINLAGVQLQIKAKNNGPAPLFSDNDLHRQQYRATIDTANKALKWWTQSNDVGNAVFKLPQGTYTISELAAPAGYELLQPFDIIVGEDGQVRLADGAPTNAEINTKDNRLNLKLTNIFKPKLKIIKVDSRDENRKLENATFKLFGEDGRTQVGSDLVTGTTGEVEIPALTPGTYYLQETQSPAGFQTNGTKYKLIIAADGTTTVENGDDLIAVAPLSTDKVIQITVKNKVKTYRLKIKKRDYDNPNTGVSGARFALYPSEGPNEDGSNKVQVLKDGRMIALEGSSYSHLDNTIDFPNIPPGEYVLRETQAPSGYTKIRDTRLQIGEDGRLTLLDADQALVSVETGQGDTLVMVAKNIRTFNFQIKKVDSTNEATLLDNAQFSIYKTDVNWTKGDTAFAQGLTRAGIYQTNLEPGYYILKEDQAPSGYLLNRNEYRFQINHDGSIYLHNPDATVSLAPADTNRLVVFTMKNTRTTSQFKLAKRSYRNPDQRLEATFELKESGNAQAPAVVKRTTTTGDEVLFDNLPVGKSYILKETVAPDGYQKIEKEIHIDIGADGTITIRDGGDLVSLDNTDSHLIIVKNLRKGEYPKTGGIGIIPYIALGGVMMLLALAVELGKEKRWKHIRK
ncbi:discoidin domain-containing protein [Streptococcus suis]|uniref:SpaA isopeptide-forming pilin-related protein n=1 Tax=Streptococcus suis TaxID=1307 RepID=UPI001C9659DC|nr:SpaA isopeptide-forming pilin-related protein [Streptococcus suis]MBY4961019.1 discoidin domain-containing protein [Streptococcus suis]MBY4967342.1 discoidin domain-containing protein [Streptococcus suis]MBY4978416.1 discoidin domain-containing protein [Streptococcus suis]MBY4986925.1 discoidin domain-containing protein [Streptococcus suis]MBY4993583.1 discoidin domain-containing protein [Streptococcus suis]